VTACAPSRRQNPRLSDHREASDKRRPSIQSASSETLPPPAECLGQEVRTRRANCRDRLPFLARAERPGDREDRHDAHLAEHGAAGETVARHCGAQCRPHLPRCCRSADACEGAAQGAHVGGDMLALMRGAENEYGDVDTAPGACPCAASRPRACQPLCHLSALAEIRNMNSFSICYGL